MLMSLEIYMAFVLASVLLILLPGPSITVIVANSTAHGTCAGLTTVAGNELGLAILLLAVFLGLASIMEVMSHWLDWVRFAGAAYLIWLGVSRIRQARRATEDEAPSRSGNGFFIQGVAVALSNPKIILFFAAFLPQFIDPAKTLGPQLAVLSVTFLVLAGILDSGYAFLAGRAKAWLSERRTRQIDQASGAVLIAGGLWLAFAKRA